MQHRSVLLSSLLRSALGRPHMRNVCVRFISTGAKPRTGIVMLNLGGPATLDEVGPFLQRMFADHDLIQLPLQCIAGPILAKRRTPKIQAIYQGIGGGSPIRRWTQLQGEQMTAILDRILPSTAPHKHYIAFRYAAPLTQDALQQLHVDGVERVIAFSQYPQYSCATTGSSLNELWRQQLLHLGMPENRFKWSIIDRWHTHPGFIRVVAKKIRQAIARIQPSPATDWRALPILERPVIIFSAHSLPIRVVNRGDPYPQEVGATVARVIDELTQQHSANTPPLVGCSYLLSYQSQVGKIPWLGPATEKVLEQLGHRGHKRVVIVPIAFTSDHIETLAEIDQQFKKTALESGIVQFERAESLNDDPEFAETLADIVAVHLREVDRGGGPPHSMQYPLRCPGCINPTWCRSILNPIVPSIACKDAVVAAKEGGGK